MTRRMNEAIIRLYIILYQNKYLAQRSVLNVGQMTVACNAVWNQEVLDVSGFPFVLNRYKNKLTLLNSWSSSKLSPHQIVNVCIILQGVLKQISGWSTLLWSFFNWSLVELIRFTHGSAQWACRAVQLGIDSPIHTLL